MYDRSRTGGPRRMSSVDAFGPPSAYHNARALGVSINDIVNTVEKTLLPPPMGEVRPRSISENMSNQPRSRTRSMSGLSPSIDNITEKLIFRTKLAESLHARTYTPKMDEERKLLRKQLTQNVNVTFSPKTIRDLEEKGIGAEGKPMGKKHPINISDWHAVAKDCALL